MTGADFGTQQGPLISPKVYRNLFKPFHVRINEWIHANTAWKTFIHSCGSIWRLLDDIVDAGFDALNPVQTSAAAWSRRRSRSATGTGSRSGAAASTRSTRCRSARPRTIRSMVRERMRVFGPGGGFVFNPIHNVQAGVPVENLLALYDAVTEFRSY